MTRAPANLLALRSLLLTHLDNAPGSDDLEPGEVGIVGDPAHRGGYHCGSDRTVTNDYSVFESPRDRNGLTLDASALDVGPFQVTSQGRTYDLAHFSRWCVEQCKANAPDTRDIREIIYSLDGTTVKRWDRLGKRSTGDSSHRWHTHISFHRDAIKAGRDQTPLFRRYLTTIGLIEAAAPMEDDMPLTAVEISAVATRVWTASWGPETAAGRLAEARDEARRARLTSEAVLAAVKGADVSVILTRINELAAEDRQRDADLAELVRAGQSGELTAEQVLGRLRDLLPTTGKA
ncbi:hypothetical protein OHA01_26410 [Micromonospora zamorensis]|uniref:hypothetical protein n=1 Tax=Micromonospora zamorensis TaxID=709883 RepID=UPI003869AE21|nr:hypothetical protein OHA01_26410 [Micromonospora zamorensis]